MIAVCRQGDPPAEDVAHLEDVTDEWLPEDTQSAVWNEEYFPPERRKKLLLGLLETGIPGSLRVDPDEADESSDESKPDARPARWWWQQVARYQKHFGLAAREVMDEPWFHFCAVRRELPTLEAREAFRYAQGAIAGDPRTDGALLSSIHEQSQFAGEADEGGEEDWQMSEEEKEAYIDKKKAKLHQVQDFLRKN